MELFTVNRYDTVEKTTHDPDREKRILDRLQKNIDKKKHNQKKPKKSDSNAADLPDAEEEETEDVLLADTPDESSSIAPISSEAGVAVDDQHAEIPQISTVTSVTNDKNVSDVNSNFQVLGTDRFRNKQRIDMVLPPWLASPTIIANDLSNTSGHSVDSLSYLSDNIKSSLQSCGIHELFPVQRAVIPWIINAHSQPDPFRPRDICVSAPTGSGKTFGYAVPIVQVLQSRLERRIRALIVLPVNELAVQVLKQFRKLCAGTTLTCGLLSKTVPFEAEQAQLVEQYEGEWYSRVDIVVATTGRLVEHLSSTPGFCLKSLQFLVMDEADRIMEQIQNNWLYHLDAHVKQQSDAFLHGSAVPLCLAELSKTVDRQPHKLLFSATLSQDPEKLKNLQLFQPKLFTAIVKSFQQPSAADGDDKEEQRRGDFVGKFTTPAGLTEKYCMTQAEVKPLTLYALIKANAWRRWLCFTNSGLTAHRLVYVLQQLFGTTARIEELSSSLLTPEKRNAVLVQYQLGQINGLVCSDALARGIDVEDVDVVISYEMPRHIKTYVHRVGRTARAGRDGLAVTLLLNHEVADFKALIMEGGKDNIDEIHVSRDEESAMAKEYAGVVEKLQEATKREQQQKVMKQVNEKLIVQTKTQQSGLLGKLQTQLRINGTELENENDVPDSWKWQNQQQINIRRERKNMSQKLKRKAEKKKWKTETAKDGDNAVPQKRGKFTKSTDN